MAAMPSKHRRAMQRSHRGAAWPGVFSAACLQCLKESLLDYCASPPGAKYPSGVTMVRSFLSVFSAILWKLPSSSSFSGV